MSVTKTRFRRLVTAVAASGLLAGLVPGVASAATPNPRDFSEFACPPDEVPDPGFTDDEGTHEAAIACIVWYRIAQGTGESSYSPENPVNRGQMATFLANLITAAQKELPASPADAFDDDNGTQHEQAINQLYARGVVNGTSEATYEPHRAVTREQMATFLNNAYEYITGTRLSSSEDFFTDDNGRHHEANINAVAAAGFAAGKSSTRFAPTEPVNRGQMASFLAREADGLVAGGEMSKPIVRLDNTAVRQGGTVTGRVIAEGATGASVSGCGLDDEPLTLTGQENAFEIEIPVSAPAGNCLLSFTVTREDGSELTVGITLTVTEIGPVTQAPELVKVASRAHAETDKVIVGFTFDEALNPAATPAVGDFKLRIPTSTSATGATGTAAFADSNRTVEVVFDKDVYRQATVATVAHAAVEDTENVANPEGHFGLSGETVAPGVTDAPDLLGLAPVPGAQKTDFVFTFDEKAWNVTEDFGRYHLVFSDGSTATGTAFARNVDGSETRTIRFGNIGERTVARGFVDADTVADDAQDDQSGIDGNSNPLQAVDVANGGADANPFLVGIQIDADAESVTYTFSRSVSVVDQTGGDFVQGDTEKFRAYLSDGTEFTSVRAVAEGSTVTAYFTQQVSVGGESDPIRPTTVGASVEAGAVEATTGNKAENNVDEMARGFDYPAGRTAAPDLLRVTRSTASGNVTLTFTFDQAPTGGESGAVFTIYQPDGSRRALVLNASAPNNDCSISGETVVCTASSSGTLGGLMASATLAGAEEAAVEDTSGAFGNSAASVPIG